MQCVGPTATRLWPGPFATRLRAALSRRRRACGARHGAAGAVQHQRRRGRGAAGGGAGSGRPAVAAAPARALPQDARLQGGRHPELQRRGLRGRHHRCALHAGEQPCPDRAAWQRRHAPHATACLRDGLPADAASPHPQEFVKRTKNWVHIDTMAYNTGSKPGRPEGGEAFALRALFEFLRRRYPSSS